MTISGPSDAKRPHPHHHHPTTTTALTPLPQQTHDIPFLFTANKTTNKNTLTSQNLLAPTIKLYGTGNSFTCPSSSAGVVDKNKVSLVDPTYAFTCTSTTGARVRVSTTLTSGPTPRASSPPTGGDGGKPGGSVAAAVIVPLIIVGAVGGGVYWWIRRRNRPRRFEHYVA